MPADGNYDRAVDIGGTKIAAAAGMREMYQKLMSKPVVWWLYFPSIFAYVGCEQEWPTGS
jgi:hypothetical protein